MEPQVYALIELLVSNYGEVVSREQIIDEVWQGRSVSNNVVDSRIRSARLALGDDGKAQRLIRTLTHQGFKFVGHVDESDDPSVELMPVTATTTVESKSRSDSKLPTRPLLRPTTVLLTIFAFVGILTAAFMLEGFITDSPVASELESRERISIAVLPSVEEGHDQDANLLSIGVSEETISFLGGVSGINVLSRSSSFAFKDRNLSSDELNEALGVDYRVESKCRVIGDKVVVNVQLIKTKDEMIIWSKRYEVDADSDKSNENQIEVARNVAQSISNSLGFSASEFNPNVISNEALESFLKAQDALSKRTPESIELSIVEFRNVIEQEPDYLPAYARLFDSYWAGINFANMPFDMAIPEMQRLHRQMTVLGKQTPETMTVEGILIPVDGRDHNPEDILKLFDEAIRINPNYVLAIQEKAYALSSAHRYKEAIDTYKQALELDPVSPDTLAALSWTQYQSGEMKAAYETAMRNMRWNQDNIVAKTALARLLMRSNHQAKALKLLRVILDEKPDSYAARFNSFWLNNKLGQFRTAQEVAPLAPQKAMSAALAGNKSEANSLASEIPAYRASKAARYIVGDPDELYKHMLKHKTDPGILNDSYGAETLDLIRIVTETDVCRIRKLVCKSQGVRILDAYYTKYPDEKFQLVDQFYGAMALAQLKGQTNRVFEVFDKANERGFVFLDLFETPLFKPLRTDPQFQSRHDLMQKNASKILMEAG